MNPSALSSCHVAVGSLSILVSLAHWFSCLSKVIHDIHVSLSENFSPEEYKEAQNLFEAFGDVDIKTYFRATYDPLTLFAIITVSFALGSFAKGFFTKMGEDAYEQFKKALAALLTRERKPIDKATTLEYVFPYNGLEIHAFLETREAEIVERAHSESKQITNLLDEFMTAKKLPSGADYIQLQFDTSIMKWKFAAAMGMSGSHFAKFKFNDSTNSWDEL